MARSLRSSRRKANKIALRKRYKPIYDARLAAIVATMKENTDEIVDSAGTIDIENQVQIVNPDEDGSMETTDADGNSTTTSTETDKTKEGKIKIPRVDIKKLTKFMSQSKLRTYNAKLKAKKKASKFGAKRKQTSW